jgi:3-oxoacyl-[acyl-carrier-protein] synthase-3
MQSEQNNSLFLLSLGHFHPENVIDNSFLESLDIDIDVNWIIDRVGIKTRRTVLPLDYIRMTKNSDPRAAEEASQYTNAETSVMAARMALSRAGLDPKSIGMVLAGGCSPKYLIPAEACLIAAHLGLECPAFDVSSACSSFAAQVHLLKCMRSETLPDYILLVNTENTTRKVNYSDRSTAVLWGDGTSAAIISPRVMGKLAITQTILQSDPSGWDKVMIPAGGFFQQNGNAVQSFAIRKSLSVIDSLCKLGSLDNTPLSFVGHQANLLMLQAVCRNSEAHISHHFYNVDHYGNCGASGAPSVLSQNWETLPDGALCVALVGSGLTWGGMLFDVDASRGRTGTAC